MKIAPAWLKHINAQRVLDLLTQAGHEAFFVGGCVRDAVLGREASDIEYFYPSRLENEPAGPDDGGFNDVHFHPVEPFAVRVGLTAAF